MNHDTKHNRTRRGFGDAPASERGISPDDQVGGPIHLPATGRWSVLTQSGARYVLDLDDRTLFRFAVDPICALRRDGEQVKLIHARCELGEVAIFVIAILPSVTTVRRTTPVVAIRPAVHGEAAVASRARPTPNVATLHRPDPSWREGGAR